MKLGIFARTFARDSIERNLDAVQDHGFVCTQYNLRCAGLPTLPDEVRPEVCERICQAHRHRGLSMAAISGTFNIIDSNGGRLAENMRRLRMLAEAAPSLKTSVITLCSGTRNPAGMWKGHPENDTASAWRDMVSSIRQIVAIAGQQRVTVAVEPEINNVVNSAAKARRLLDEVGSSHLKIVFDAANLLDAGNLSVMREIIDEAIELLGADIVIAHAKDIGRDGAHHVAAGTGILDYDFYLHRLNERGFDGPLIAHGLEEDQVADCACFLRAKLAKLQRIVVVPSDVSGELRDASV